MSADLRDLMHRVADDVEPVRVAPDTFRRARRARTRNRAVVSALAVVLVVGGLVVGIRPSLLPTPLDPVGRPMVGSEGAVPDRIHQVPDALDQEGGDGAWPAGQVPAARVGRASAAYTTLSGQAVLVSAADGEHHRVALPGFWGQFAAMSDEVALSVSPDGTRVAYTWRRERAAESGRWPSGLAMLRLDGPADPDVYRLPGGVGVRTTDFSWSPDGDRLTYRVGVLHEVTGSSFRAGSYRAEVLAVPTGRRVVAGRVGASNPPAVSDSGQVAEYQGDLALWSQATDSLPKVPLPAGSGGSVVWSPDANVVAVSGEDLLVVDLLTTQARPVAPLPELTRLLGWVGSDHVLAVTRANDEPDDLLLVDVVDGSTRVVGTADGDVNGGLSIATGLMTPEQPTVEFDPPSWVPWHERWRDWIELVGGLVLLGGLVYAWRRAARRGRGSRRGSRS